MIVMAAGDPVPAIHLADARIAAVLGDPGTSFWVKSTLLEARQRDPVDVARDAMLVAQLLGERVDALLADLSGR